MEFQFPMPLSYISTDSVLDYSYRRIIRLLMFFVNPPLSQPRNLFVSLVFDIERGKTVARKTNIVFLIYESLERSAAGKIEKAQRVGFACPLFILRTCLQKPKRQKTAHSARAPDSRRSISQLSCFQSM